MTSKTTSHNGVKIESAKDHIEHVLQTKNRKAQLKAMKGFGEWLAAMPEFQREIYIHDLLKTEHFLLESGQKMEMKSLREEAVMELSDAAKAIIEKTFENLHERTHSEEGEALESD